MKTIITSLSILASLAVGACSSGGGNAPGDPTPPSRQQQLIAKGECSFEACGSSSSMASAPRIECSMSQDKSCEWSVPDDGDQAVSYAFCSDSECPPRPAIVCPSGTVKASQQCGNENDAGCAWTTVCTPPRVTTPCPSQRGCDNQARSDIGIVCSDGSNGDFVCVTDGQKCFWERSCD